MTTPSPTPGGAGVAGAALHRQVVGLGAAGGEHDLGGARAEELGDLLPGLLERGLGRAGRRVAPARVAERAPQEGLHRRDGLGPHRRGGGVVEVGERANSRPLGVYEERRAGDPSHVPEE